jgi:hypothetical protein
MKLITLKAKEIKENISLHLQEILSDDGFVYKKTRNEFSSTIKSFTYTFNIEQVAWSTSFSLGVRLYVSQKQIEFILEQIIGKQRHKITMGGEIGRIYKTPDGREIVNGDLSIWLRQDEDIEAAIESLKWYYEDIAKPYFKRYNNLNAIDDIMNNPPFEHCPAHVAGNFYERCMKGLIVARLVNNPDYEKLAAIYDEEIKGTMSEELIGEYKKVRDYLRYNQIGGT